MTVNQKKSLIAFYLSKFNNDAVKALGYKGSSQAMTEISKLLGSPNKYISQRRDEFDIFFENGRKGRWKREPSKGVKEYYAIWKDIEFYEFTEMVQYILNGIVEMNQGDLQ
jgi:hypothetical protein